MALAGKAIRNEPVRQLRGSSVNEVNERLKCLAETRLGEIHPRIALLVCIDVNSILRWDMEGENKGRDTTKYKKMR